MSTGLLAQKGSVLVLSQLHQLSICPETALHMLNLVQETYMTPSFYFQWRCHSKTKKKPYPSPREKCPYRMFCPLFTAWEDVFQFLVLSVSLTASPLLPRPTTLDEEVLSSNNWGRDCQGAGLMRMDNAAATLAILESVSAAGPTAATPLPPWAAGNGRWDGQLPQKQGCGTCVPEGLL